MGATLPPLIGRDRELRVLQAALDEVEGGGAVVVVMEGAAGLGRTRLLDDLIARAEASVAPWAVLSCRFGEFDTDRPFAALRDGLADLLAELSEPTDPHDPDDPDDPDDPVDGDEGPDHAERVPTEIGDGLALLRKTDASDAGRGEHVTQLIVEGLTELARTRPLLIAADDLRWIDAASARVLSALARRRRRASVLMVMACRPSDRPVVSALRRALASQQAQELFLRPLTAEDARALALAVFNEASPNAGRTKAAPRPLDDLVRALIDAADGNPLFIVELARAARRALDALGADETSGASPFPRSVRSIVNARLSGLPEMTQDTLGDAALLGRTFDPNELAIVGSVTLDAVVDALGPAVLEGLVASSGHAMRFSQALVHEHVAALRPAAQRIQRHAQFADRLAMAGAPPTRVGEHLWLSEPAPSDEAASMMRSAAAEVRGLSLEAALVWLTRARALAPPHERVAADLALAEANLLLGRLTEVDAICTSLDRATLSDAEAMTRTRTRATVALMAGPSRHDEAVTALDWLVERIAPGDPDRVDIEGWRALVSLYGADLDGAQQLAAAAVAQPIEREHEHVRSRAYEALSLAATLRGEPAEAKRCAQLSLRCFRAEASPWNMAMVPHTTCSLALLTTEHIEEVMSTARAGAELCAEAGHHLGRLHVEPLIAVAQFAAGQLDFARRTNQYTLLRASLLGSSGIALPGTTGLAAHLALLDDDLDAARTLAEDTMRQLLAGDAQAGTADFAAWCAACVFEADGDVERARSVLVAVWELLARDASLFVIAPDLVRLLCTYDRAAALSVTEVVTARAVHTEAILDRAHAAACKGILDRQVSLLDEAARSMRTLGWRFPANRLDEYSLSLVIPGSPEYDARLRSVLAAWESMEARRPLRLLGTRQAPKRVGAIRRPVSGPESLSTAERAVVRLVSEGLTNKEIAQRLFVSHRTIDTHVSHALAKLGATSRVQLGLVGAELPR